MPDPTTLFEAMMAGFTAPPLSLCEFRLFVAHDLKARNALAFCEWYQRYRTVYFDHVSLHSTKRTTASSRLGLPPQFTTGKPSLPQPNMNTQQAANISSRASISIPNRETRMYDGPYLGPIYTLKSHSFSALSESIADSTFHTTTTTSSSLSTSKKKRLPINPPSACTNPNPNTIDLSPGCAEVSSLANNKIHTNRSIPDVLADQHHAGPSLSTIIRRCTLPSAPNDSWLEYTNRDQEHNRRQIQSLLVFECWARFLAPHAQEKFQPYAQLKQNLISRVHMRRLNVSQAPSPLSQCVGLGKNSNSEFETKATDDNGESKIHISAKRSNGSVRDAITGLRRISTMPALKIRNVIYSTLQDEDTELGNDPFPHVSRARHLIPISELQMYHQTLKPQPLFTAPTADYLRTLHACGYKPVPKQISKLIMPNAVPPAIFETIAKLSAEYLLQSYFADFFSQAHYNITTNEQIVIAIAAGLVFLLGATIAAVFIILTMPIAWRACSIPFLFLAPILLCAAWTRVSIWRWWICRRTTGLIIYRKPAPNEFLYEEKAAQTDCSNIGAHLKAVQAVTGTLLPEGENGVYVGAIPGTSCRIYSSIYSESSYGHPAVAPCYRDCEDGGGVFTVPMWAQQPSTSSIVDRIFDKIVQLMLRNYHLGDQWSISLQSKQYKLLIRQCFAASAILLHIKWQYSLFFGLFRQ
ncbi:hypothetical protein BX070DRAFT_232291 [Coemansia spiralis]|nr:hypothetical protein BX070DRAFT_232291 [Coemansia spiralis]